MTTLLQLVNSVLAKIGESRVSTVNANVVSRLCAQNVSSAILAIIDESNEWPWLTQTFVASSWSGNVATMPGTLININFVRDNGSDRILQYMEDRTFSLRTPLAYTGANGGAMWYTIRGQQVLFDPYPNDATAQANILFHGGLVSTLPTLDTDVLQIPQRDENMLLHRVAMMMAIDHLMDNGKAQAYMMEYQKALQMAKSRLTGDTADRRRSAIW